MPLFGGLYVVALAEQAYQNQSHHGVLTAIDGMFASARGDLATAKNKFAAALKDPLALFADRSPGARDPGPLHLTKGGPHERVLAALHHRKPGPLDSGLTSDGPGDLDLGPQGVPTLFTNDGFPTGDGSFPDTPPVTFDLTSPPVVNPFDPDFPTYPPGGPNGPNPPTGPNPPPNGPNPPPTGAPEPASWTLMLFGLVAPVAVERRRRRTRSETRHT